MNPNVPLLAYTPRPPRYRAKFRVMIPDPQGKPALLSNAVHPYHAQRIAQQFRQQDTIAVIWADTRSLRDLYAHAPERGVRRFEAIFHANLKCPCGCGREALEIVFPPAIDLASVSPETPATKAIVLPPLSPAAMPQTPPTKYWDFAKQLMAQICGSLGIPKKFL